MLTNKDEWIVDVMLDVKMCLEASGLTNTAGMLVAAIDTLRDELSSQSDSSSNSKTIMDG